MPTGDLLMPQQFPIRFSISFHFGMGDTFTWCIDVTEELFNASFPSNFLAPAPKPAKE
jgi:hypothetical protein